jgi:2-keto-4-pentenoate hydratase/2-oxohepta-3-ene-1,7-dioic acid hydratase in catechol pathway
MRLVTYDAGEGPLAGVRLGDEIAPAGFSVRQLLAAGEPITYTTERIAVGDVRLLAPVPDPEKIICLGLNYRAHAEESNLPIPENPLWFAKFANSLIGDGQAIVLPKVHNEYVDYEAEMAIVIGKAAHKVSADDALDCIAGAMAFNDVSARDLQWQNTLWTSGKAVDTFAPCGELALIDEIDDLDDLTLRTTLNGEVVQEGKTDDLIFGVAESIAWLARTITLLPGDIIATGTPSGIGTTKGLFLRDGDTCQVEIVGHSSTTNPVRQG